MWLLKNGWRGEMLLASKMGEGAMSQRRHVDSLRSWERQETESPLEPPERNIALLHLDFSPVRRVLDFRLAELQDNTFVLFKPLSVRVTCYSNNRK